MYANPRSGRAELARAAELAQAAGDDWALVQAQQFIAEAYMIQQDHAQAARASDEVTALAERLGDPLHVFRPLWHVAWMAAFDGHLAEARNAAVQMRAAIEGVGEPLVEILADFGLGYIDVWEGEPERSLERLHRRLESALKLGAGFGVPYLLVVIAFAELAAGRLAQARDRLQAVVPLVEGRVSYASSWALGLLAEARRLLGDGDAKSTALEAQASGEQIDNRFLATRARLTWGAWPPRAANGRTRSSTLSRTWTRARRAATRPSYQGAWTRSPRSRRGSAPTRTRCGCSPLPSAPAPRSAWSGCRPRRSTGRRSTRGCVRRSAKRHTRRRARQGAELSLEDALEWARRARGPRKRPPGGWASLTPTESRVVELVAEGLTNPQVAERMFVSPGTVKTHLSHVFRKLDVHSRAELSAQAVGRRKTAS